jgi:hypothetical protein
LQGWAVQLGRNIFILCQFRIEAQQNAAQNEGSPVNRIIYLVGLVVVILAILSFFGLR